MDRFEFNNWAKSYDEDVRKSSLENDWMFQGYDLVLDEIVEQSSFTKRMCSTVLDIGVGTGNLAVKFFNKGLNVIGIDPSEEMRKICRQKYPDITVLEGNFLNIPLEPDSVDLIVSAYAFHHLTSQQKTESIPVMNKVLKSDGRIIIADLMFENITQEQIIKSKLIDSGQTELVNEIEEEYLGLFNTLTQSFINHGFTVQGKQLTEAVWIICATYNN